MAIENARTENGKDSAAEYRQRTEEEERKVESQKGSHLKKGAERVEERSRSSDGNSAGDKQHD